MVFPGSIIIEDADIGRIIENGQLQHPALHLEDVNGRFGRRQLIYERIPVASGYTRIQDKRFFVVETGALDDKMPIESAIQVEYDPIGPPARAAPHTQQESHPDQPRKEPPKRAALEFIIHREKVLILDQLLIELSRKGILSVAACSITVVEPENILGGIE